MRIGDDGITLKNVIFGAIFNATPQSDGSPFEPEGIDGILGSFDHECII